MRRVPGMDEHGWLTERFEEHRSRLHSMAYRMLGSASDAEDAVQEGWLRASRGDAAAVANVGAWLTTIVARVSLNMLRSRRSRPDTATGGAEVDTVAAAAHDDDVLLADSVGRALLIVLDRLTPAERVAFVLHDTFGVPYDDIAPIIGRSPAAARQLASRARRRVRDAEAEPDRARQRHVADAFLAAARAGDFGALLALLDPDIVLRVDEAALQLAASAPGAPALARQIRGAEEVARTFVGRARAAQPALIDGVPGLVWAPGGRPRVVFALTIGVGTVSGIEMIADPARIDALEVTLPVP